MVSMRISDLCEKGVRGLSIRKKSNWDIEKFFKFKGYLVQGCFGTRWMGNQILGE
jgi:hypothetical protein